MIACTPTPTASPGRRPRSSAMKSASWAPSPRSTCSVRLLSQHRAKSFRVKLANVFILTHSANCRLPRLRKDQDRGYCEQDLPPGEVRRGSGKHQEQERHQGSHCFRLSLWYQKNSGAVGVARLQKGKWGAWAVHRGFSRWLKRWGVSVAISISRGKFMDLTI